MHYPRIYNIATIQSQADTNQQFVAGLPVYNCWFVSISRESRTRKNRLIKTILTSAGSASNIESLLSKIGAYKDAWRDTPWARIGFLSANSANGVLNKSWQTGLPAYNYWFVAISRESRIRGIVSKKQSYGFWLWALHTPLESLLS